MAGGQAQVEGDGALRATFVGPVSARARASVLESGAELVAEVQSADVVHLTLEPASTAEALDDLIGIGKNVVLHVLPSPLDADHVGRLRSRAAEAGLVVAVPFVQRYYPMVRLARRRVRSGAPGPLHLMHGWSLRGVVPAWFDLIEFVSRHRVQRIVSAAVASTWLESRDGDIELPGAVGLLFATDRGCVGTLAVSHSRPIEGGTCLVVLDGVEESIVFHEGRPEVLDVMGRSSTQRFQRGVGADLSRYSTQPTGAPQGTRDCWSAFIADAHAAVRGGTPDGLATLADLARSAALSETVRRSEASGTWTAVGAGIDRDLLTTTEGNTA